MFSYIRYLYKHVLRCIKANYQYQVYGHGSGENSTMRFINYLMSYSEFKSKPMWIEAAKQAKACPKKSHTNGLKVLANLRIDY